MPTINQLCKGVRKKKSKFALTKSLENNPQKKAVCIKVTTRKPKKPNSAIRKIAKVRLSNSKKVLVYIPGQGHSLQEHSVILVRGGKTKDLPGLHYKAVRGVNDFLFQESFSRKQSRSKYGIPKKV